ncbi:MAG: peptidoglycan editing factor PgeF, partial [Neisseria sp.]|nr:peptidoglycan editing factor PgeF [Neisseria sp.]
MDLKQKLDLPEIETPFLRADWNAPSHVKTLISTRQGGVSEGVYASLNVGNHVGDAAEHVARNREIVQTHIGVPVAYLKQTHSTIVVQASDSVASELNADASVNADGTAACAVMTADCLPVLFCDKAGTVVAAAHAGWRGLAGGILQNTVAAMNVPSAEILAYLGPAIGAEAFEVGEDVRQAFIAQNDAAASAFTAIGEHDGQTKYLADIYQLARLALQAVGVVNITGGEHCTVLEREHFFSYRRDGQTGRMVSAIWL